MFVIIIFIVLYTIKFLKCGLPHAHILLWLDEEHKYLSITYIDFIICVELPDKHIESIGYESVMKFMMHDPC